MSDGAAKEARPLAIQTAIGALWLLVWRLLSRSLGLVSTLVLARVLVPADFGLIAMATTFAGAVDALSQLGLQDALVRHVGDSRRLFNTAFTLQVCRGALTALVVAGASPLAAEWFNEPRLIPVLLVLAVSSLAAGFENIGIAEFRQQMRYDRQVRLLFLPRLLQVCCTISAALLLQSYWALLIGIVVGQLGRVAMTYVAHPFRPRFGLAEWRELAGFSLWTWASWVASLVWDRIDPFVLGPTVGSTKLGLYLLGAELAMLPLSELVAPVADALFAAFAAAQKDGSSSVHHAPSVATMLVLVVMPMAVTLSYGADFVIEALLGPKWHEAAPIVAAMAWLCVASPISFVCNAVLVANGRVRRSFTGRLTASIVKTVAFVAVLSVTRRLDVVAIAMTICVFLECCAFTLLLRGLLKESLRPHVAAFVRILLAGVLAMLVLQQSGSGWQNEPISALRAALVCIEIALLALTIYIPLISGLWVIAGRPAGPETRALEMMRHYGGLLRVRLSASGP
ncbi:MAG TPA: oligosaccharide flippase family protein [Acetobacteraceae bacterium]|nr:oligosaccharide flippase family protein [Acetobacteraceae bacterium]